MMSINIQIDQATHTRLKQVAAKEGLSLRETVNMLLDRFGKDAFEEIRAIPLEGLEDKPLLDNTTGAGEQ